MKRSLRTLAMALTVIGSTLTVAGPAAAATHVTTGARIVLFLADGSTYPAATAFYVEHGFAFEPGDAAAGKYRFSLTIDGVTRAATYTVSTVYPDGSLESRLWIFDVPNGLTGTHTLTGHWFVPCGSTTGVDCGGRPRNTLIETATVSATVTFS